MITTTDFYDLNMCMSKLLSINYCWISTHCIQQLESMVYFFFLHMVFKSVAPSWDSFAFFFSSLRRHFSIGKFKKGKWYLSLIQKVYKSLIQEGIMLNLINDIFLSNLSLLKPTIKSSFINSFIHLNNKKVTKYFMMCNILKWK